MALTLLLLRHAKASWDRPGIDDFDRELTARGRLAAAEMGERMAASGYVPRRIVCSTARRTRETFAALIPHISSELDAMFTRSVYGADAGDLLDLLQAVAGAPSPLLLVGHNPGVQDLANLLVTDGDADARLHLAAKYPPGALAVIELPIEAWSAAGTTTGALTAFLVPAKDATAGGE